MPCDHGVVVVAARIEDAGVQLRPLGLAPAVGSAHRRLIAELLHARGEQVVHLLGPGKQQKHKPLLEAEARDGRLYLCGALVA
jgi:hypothetical protein